MLVGPSLTNCTGSSSIKGIKRLIVVSLNLLDQQHLGGGGGGWSIRKDSWDSVVFIIGPNPQLQAG